MFPSKTALIDTDIEADIQDLQVRVLSGSKVRGWMDCEKEKVLFIEVLQIFLGLVYFCGVTSRSSWSVTFQRQPEKKKKKCGDNVCHLVLILVN